jgi:capsular exopolysaccharide synthesis family protein
VSPWDIRDEPTEEPIPQQRIAAVDVAAVEVAAIEAAAVEREDRPAPVIARVDHRNASSVAWPTDEGAEKLVVSPGVSSLARAQYSKLAAALHHAQLERGIKVLMFISTGPAEGKTLTAVNVALTLSEGYRRRVLLIDADLRRPTIHSLLELPSGPGLTDLLTATRPLPLVQVSPQLWVLAGGDQLEGDPPKTLTSERMDALVQEARDGFDWVVIDTPPVGIVPDARLLAPLADAALLVVMAGLTEYDEIQRAAETFDPSILIGIVLNRVPERICSSSYGPSVYVSARTD